MRIAFAFFVGPIRGGRTSATRGGEVRVAAASGLPDAGRVLDLTEIRRVQEVAAEVRFAMLTEVKRRKSTVSLIPFDEKAYLAPTGAPVVSRSRDYTKAENALLDLEPAGGTYYGAALRVALDETTKAGGKAMNALATDALTSDLLGITSGLERDLQAKYEEAARYCEQQKGGRQVALQYRQNAREIAGQPAMVKDLVKAGPWILVCLGQNPDTDPELRQALQMMRDGYGANFEIGVFPDVSSEDAVFQAAKGSVKLAKAT